MNAAAANYLWDLILTGLITPFGADRDAQYSRLFSEEIDIPKRLEEKLSLYFSTHENTYLVEAAIDVVKYYYLTDEMPDEHLVLVAFLLKNKFISVDDACAYSQIDASNFYRMSKDALILVSLAKAVAEEEKIGFKIVKHDDFLEKSLLDFSRLKGFLFA